MNRKSSDRYVFQIVSAIPGRFRLQFSPSAARSGAMLAVASNLRDLPGMEDVEVVPNAFSLIARFDRREYSLPAFAGKIDAAAQAAFPGAARSPIQVDSVRKRPDAVRLPYSVRSPIQEDSVPNRLPATSVQRQTLLASDDRFAAALTQLARKTIRKWKHSAHRDSGQTETITAQSMPPEKPRGLKGLVLPSLAVALAATEILPVAITGVVLGIASIPIFQRAAKGMGKRQLTVDELDLANVIILAVEGSLLPASAVTWLIGLGELIRGETVRSAQREIGPAAYQGTAFGQEDTRRLIAELLKETLSNTRSQDTAIRAANGFTYPLAGLGIVMAFVWRDPGVFIDIFKPRSDFEAAVRFHVPTSLLTAITRAERRGIRFGSGAAVEALATADAFLFIDMPSHTGPERFGALVETLANRGARTIAAPTALSQAAQRHLEGVGVSDITFMEEPINAQSIHNLRAQGFRVALISTGANVDSELLDAAEMCLVLQDNGKEKLEGREVVVANGPADVPFAVDTARRTMKIVTQNVAVTTGAAAFNLANGLLQVLPSPVSTLVNTLTIAATATNLQRSRGASRQPGQKRLPQLRGTVRTVA